MGVPIPPNPMEELEKNKKRAEDMNKATITCPECGHKEEVEIPQNGCLAFHKCEKCEKLISVPEGSDNCCVICEYSDKTCPVGHKDEKKNTEETAPKCSCCS